MSGVGSRIRFWRDHRWAADHMSDYLDDDLTPARHRRMERHLRECRRCRTLLAALRSIIHDLRALPDPGRRDAAVRIAAAVRARLSGPAS